jgi:hypothetical protein
MGALSNVLRTSYLVLSTLSTILTAASLRTPQTLHRRRQTGIGPPGRLCYNPLANLGGD